MKNKTLAKKIVLMTIGLPMIIGCFTACEEEQQNIGKTVTFNISAPQQKNGIQTKAGFSENIDGLYPVVWEEGDQIRISLN